MNHPSCEPPVADGKCLDTARAADAQWRADRREHHERRVQRLQAAVEKVERTTARLLAMWFLGTLAGTLATLGLQALQGREGWTFTRLFIIPNIIAATVVVALGGAITEALLRWRLKKLLERGWRDGIDLSAPSRLTADTSANSVGAPNV